jgi:chemotaxis signal transduction protein
VNPRTPSRKSPLAEAVILFGLGDVTFAISAKDVDEIREKAGLLAAGDSAPSTCVKAKLVREGKTHWVIEGSEHFRMPASRSSKVLVLRNTNTAVLVDRIDRMAEIAGVVPLPQAFHGQEREWYRGLAIFDDKVPVRAVPVVNARAFAVSVETGVQKASV